MSAFKTLPPDFVPPEQRAVAPDPIPYRMLFVGVQGVGKYSLHHQFIYACFPSIRDPFFDSEATEILWKSEDVKGLTFRIDPTRMNISRPNDVAASEHLYPDFRLPVDMFRFADNNGTVLIYSITSRSSFEALESFVDARTREKRSGEVEPKVLCLIGNKLDNSRQSRKVLCIEGEKLAGKLGCTFVECSAKDQKGLDKVKNAIIKAMDNQRNIMRRDGTLSPKQEHGGSVRSPSQASKLVRRLSEVGMLRSDTQRSSSSSERDVSREVKEMSIEPGPVQQNVAPPTNRWKNATLATPSSSVPPLSHSRARAANPLAQPSTTRIDEEPEEDVSTEESRSSSQQSSNPSVTSAVTVTPPTGVASLERLIQYRPRLERTGSRSHYRQSADHMLAKDIPRSHSLQIVQIPTEEVSNDAPILSYGRSISSPIPLLHNGVTSPLLMNDTPFMKTPNNMIPRDAEVQDSGNKELIEFLRMGPPIGPPVSPFNSPSNTQSTAQTNGHSNTFKAQRKIDSKGPQRAKPQSEVASEKARTLPAIKLTQPIQPVQSIQSVQPVEPIQPVQAVQTFQPIQPIQPIQSFQESFEAIHPGYPIHSIADTQDINIAPAVQQPQDVQYLVDRMLETPTGERSELENERRRIEVEKKRLEDQMKALEEQQKLLDEKRRKGEETRLREEKEKRMKERKQVMEWQRQERVQLEEKHKQEMELLEEKQRLEITRLQHPDDDPALWTVAAEKKKEPEVELARSNSEHGKEIPWPPTQMTEKGRQRQSQVVMNGHRQEAAKLRQQEMIDNLWVEDRAPPVPPPRSLLHKGRRQSPDSLRPQDTQESPPLRSRSDPSKHDDKRVESIHSPTLRSPLYQTHFRQQSDENPNRTMLAGPSQPSKETPQDDRLPISPVSGKNSLEQPLTTDVQSEVAQQAVVPERPANHKRSLSVGVTAAGPNVTTLGTLFTLRHTKNTPTSPTQKVPPRKLVKGDSWTGSDSRPRLPFPGKYI